MVTHIQIRLIQGGGGEETFIYPKTKKGNREAELLLRLVGQERLECEYYALVKRKAKAQQIAVRYQERIDRDNSQLLAQKKRLEQINATITNYRILLKGDLKENARIKLKANLQISDNNRFKQIEKVEKTQNRYNENLVLFNKYNDEYNNLFKTLAEMPEPEKIKVEINHITI